MAEVRDEIIKPQPTPPSCFTSRSPLCLFAKAAQIQTASTSLSNYIQCYSKLRLLISVIFVFANHEVCQCLSFKHFLLGLHPKKHNYCKNEQAFVDLSLLYAKKVYCTVMENIHRPSTYSMDETAVIKPSIRKDN